MEVYEIICKRPKRRWGRIILLAIFFVIVCVALAHADPWPNATPEEKAFFNSQLDENGDSCCYGADAPPVHVEKKDGYYYFDWQGKSYQIPPEKIQFVEHTPRDRQIVWFNFVSGVMYVHCARFPYPKI